MLQLKPLDHNVPIFQQINAAVSPVVLVNICQVAEEGIPALLKAWQADANWIKQQPGYILTNRDPVASRHCRQHGIHELCRVGIGGPFSDGVHPSRVQTGAGQLPVERRGVTAFVRAARGAQSVRRSVVGRLDWRGLQGGAV